MVYVVTYEPSPLSEDTVRTHTIIQEKNEM